MASPWPQLFSKQGIPLYQAAEAFQALTHYENLSVPVTAYRAEIEHVLTLGHNADETGSKEDRMAFLLALRTVQKRYDRIIGLSQRQLLDAMDQDNFEIFLRIVDTLPQTYNSQPNLKEQVLSYYQKHKGQGRSRSIEQLLEKEKGIIKVYAPAVERYSQTPNQPRPTQSKAAQNSSKTKDVSLIFRPGCPWCAKAFAYFNEHGIKYSAYNVNSSKGKRLFKRHNGTGVPLIIIDDQIIRGFSAQSIAYALQH